MDLQQTISNQTDFGLGITKHLLRTDFKEKNMVYSPISIHMVPSLVAAAEANGPKLHQFLSVLKSNSSNLLNFLAYKLLTSVLADASAAGAPCLNLANGLWVDRSHHLDDSYVQVACNCYKAALNQADFKSNPDGVRIEFFQERVHTQSKFAVLEVWSATTTRKMLLYHGRRLPLKP